MIASLICGLALLAPPSFTCPVAKHEAPNDGPKMDYAGIRYSLCCADCVPAFAKDPAKFAMTKEKDQVIGVALFDMTSGKRIELKNAKATTTVQGVVFPFESAANKDAFVKVASAKDFALPKKEAVYCAVMNHPLASVEKSGGFVDHEGVRYYVCCAACLPKMKAEPGKFAGNAKSAVTEARASEVKKG